MGSIVGVLADFHSQSLHEPIAPTFFSTSKAFSRIVSIKLSIKGKQISDFKETIEKIEKAWKDVYPAETFAYTFFDDSIAKLYSDDQKTAQIMNIEMAIAIFISCMRLFSLATFTAQQRRKEIGIRKVLGASVPGIVSMLSKDFMALVFIAILIASPIAYYFMHRWLVFIIAGVIAVLITFSNISFQSIRAALANPVKSLRTE